MAGVLTLHLLQLKGRIYSLTQTCCLKRLGTDSEEGEVGTPQYS